MTSRTDDTDLRKRDLLVAAVLVAVLFAIYAAGASRTIYVGDSGELVTAVHVLGIPHPTGYPLYILLGKLWTLLVPVGSIAFRMSLFSAACAAAACGVLFVLCRRLGMGVPAALTAALCLAFGPSFWGEANVQRVYSLNALFTAVATLFASEWYRRRELRFFVLTVFAAALGAANHSFMAIYLAAFGLFALVTDAAFVFRLRVLALSAVAVVCGLLPYLYLPIAARFDPLMAWGDPSSFRGFLDTVLRRDFADRSWLEGPYDLLVIAADFALGVARELGRAGAALAVIGCVAGWRRRWPVLLALMVILGNAGVMAVHGGPRDLFLWYRYYIPSYFMAALLAGMGAEFLVARMPRALRVLPLAVPLFLLVSGWQRADRSDYRIAEDFSRRVLESLPANSTLAAADDNVLFVLLYLTLVEGVRPDVNLVVHGTVPVPPSATFDPEKQPFFFTHNPSLRHPELEAVPMGLTFRVWRRGVAPPELVMPPEEMPGSADSNVPKDHDTQNLLGHYYLMRAFALEQRDWLEAQRDLQRAARAAPDHDVLFQNLGILYFRNGLDEEAVVSLRRSCEIKPRGCPVEDTIEQVLGEMQRVAAVEQSLRDAAGIPSAATPDDHLRMAGLMQDAGEYRAARGHYLRSLAGAGTERN